MLKKNLCRITQASLYVPILISPKLPFNVSPNGKFTGKKASLTPGLGYLHHLCHQLVGVEFVKTQTPWGPSTIYNTPLKFNCAQVQSRNRSVREAACFEERISSARIFTQKFGSIQKQETFESLNYT